MLEGGYSPADLVVSDIKLLGMSGAEPVLNLRKIHLEARAILITGHSSSLICRQVEEFGVVTLLGKPLGTSLFPEAVASIRCWLYESAPGHEPPLSSPDHG
jgi:response regulator RpfG family c-di-GMP phosphodiesterase